MSSYGGSPDTMPCGNLRSEFQGLPVLMVSGLPDETVIKDWIGETDFDVFPKPFRSDALLNKVRQMIA
jgi:DNA-binding response OmpR family regulator